MAKHDGIPPSLFRSIRQLIHMGGSNDVLYSFSALFYAEFLLFLCLHCSRVIDLILREVFPRPDVYCRQSKIHDPVISGQTFDLIDWKMDPGTKSRIRLRGNDDRVLFCWSGFCIQMDCFYCPSCSYKLACMTNV